MEPNRAMNIAASSNGTRSFPWLQERRGWPRQGGGGGPSPTTTGSKTALKRLFRRRSLRLVGVVAEFFLDLPRILFAGLGVQFPQSVFNGLRISGLGLLAQFGRLFV